MEETHGRRRPPGSLESVRAPRCWIGVASRDHVLRGVAGGFAMLNHGRAAALRRMQPGDRLIYYSPRLTHPDGAPCRAFTAFGRVAGGVEPSPDLPGYHRRRVEWREAREATIAPLVSELSFIRDPQRWSAPFRFGHLEIPEPDARRIARAMGITW